MYRVNKGDQEDLMKELTKDQKYVRRLYVQGEQGPIGSNEGAHNEPKICEKAICTG